MNKFSILAKWAIRFTFLAIFWSYLEKLLGYHDIKIESQFSFGLIFGIVYITVYYLCLNEVFTKIYSNTINYKSAFKNLAALTLFIAFLSPFPHLVMHNYISPDFFANAIAYKTQIDPKNLEFAKSYFTLKSFVLNGIQVSFSIGILLAAILPVFFINRVKKNQDLEPVQTAQPKFNKKGKKIKNK